MQTPTDMFTEKKDVSSWEAFLSWKQQLERKPHTKRMHAAA